MLNISTATYIKKLVKIIYEKEKQIEILKKTLKNTATTPDDQRIDKQIRNQLQYTSTQLKQVNQQINTMERSMAQLESDLDQQINKNLQNQQRIQRLLSQNQQLKDKILQLQEQIQSIYNKYEQVSQNIETSKQREKTLTHQQMQLLLKIRKTEGRINQTNNQSQLQNDKLYNQVKNYEQQNKKINAQNKQVQSLQKQVQRSNIRIQQITRDLNQKQQTISHKQDKIIEMTQTIDRKQQQIINKQNQIQKLQCDLQIRQNQNKLINQSLKNYKQFYYSINQYIESAYTKYCSEVFLQSTRKIYTQNDQEQNRFEPTFKKFSAIQNWMEDASSRIQKLKIPEVGIQTIQNLSLIVHSFQNKLQNCDLTERLQKDREDMLHNEQLLLDNLQKGCQSSYQHDRIKAVQLDQMKQILKMTKEVNRELMDQINRKEFVISECRKIYSSLLGNKVGQQYKAVKQMLNIKSK